jgi:hypothetical protein
MKRLIAMSALLAMSSLACQNDDGRPEELSDWDEDHVETPDATDELEDPAPGPDLDDGEDPQTPEQPGRITYMAEDDGDLLVHATFSDEVAVLYSAADHYQIRFTADSATLVEIRGVNGELYDLMRVGEHTPVHFPSQERTKQVCFPFPQLPPGNCYAPPCEWPDGFPGGGWPNCIEIFTDQDAGRSSIIGAVDGIPVGKELIETANGVEIYDSFDTPLEPQHELRLTKVQVVLDDLNSLLPEIDPLGPDCFDCWWKEHSAASLAVGCTQTPLLCYGAWNVIPDAWDCAWEC